MIVLDSIAALMPVHYDSDEALLQAHDQISQIGYRLMTLTQHYKLYTIVRIHWQMSSIPEIATSVPNTYQLSFAFVIVHR